MRDSNNQLLAHINAPDSVFKRIPPEIWSIIFLRCLLPYPHDNHLPVEEVLRDPRLVPMIISSVCQSWRHIACGTAELWATCRVNFLHPELNALWLGRAGPCLLHLYGKYYGVLWNFYSWAPLFHSILPFQRRWKSLELDVGLWGTMNFIPHFETCELETFRLLDGNEMPGWMAALLPNSPKLHNLKIDSVGLGTSFSIVDISPSSLSTLKIGLGVPREVILVLSALPQLRHFSILLDKDYDTFSDLSVVTHHNLISLALEGAFDASILLQNFTLPMLHTLHMTFDFDCDSFLNFIHRSQCRIKDLSVGRRWLLDEELVNTLRDSSVHTWVERLDIPGLRNGVWPQFMDFMCGPYLPHLSQLVFRRVGSVEDGLLADMIIFRRRSGYQVYDIKRDDTEIKANRPRLRYVSVDYLDRETHGLDIARLVPLPDDREGVDSKDNEMIIDLVPILKVLHPRGLKLIPTRNPVRFWIGKPSSSVSELSEYADTPAYQTGQCIIL